MFQNILTDDQKKLLPLLKLFNKEFCLVSGTAIALYLRYRYSIVFDLFTNKKLRTRAIKNVLKSNNSKPEQTLFEDFEQLHFIINKVKITFFSYPLNFYCENNFEHIIKIAHLLDLAALKAFALGGRAKWKDYVDLYFLLKYHYALDEIINKANEMFGTFFSEKLFREQLTYYKDIDYSEEVVYFNKEIPESEIRDFLTSIATNKFTN